MRITNPDHANHSKWIELKTYLLRYIYSLILWIPLWYIVAFLAIVDPSMFPILSPMHILVITLPIYPISIIGAFCAALFFIYVQQYRFFQASLFLPLSAIVVIVLGTLVSGVIFEFEKRQQISDFWAYPPKKISDFDFELSQSAKPEIDSTFDHVFILTGFVTNADIEYWDGQQLVYKTSMPTDKIRAFYVTAYRNFNFQSLSAGGGKGFQDVTYKIDHSASVSVRISNEDSQSMTRVMVTVCPQAWACGEIEDRRWE